MLACLLVCLFVILNWLLVVVDVVVVAVSFVVGFVGVLSTAAVPVALTLIEFKFAHKLMQSFHRLASQHQSTQVNRKSSVYA